jgi:hypothetical protein
MFYYYENEGKRHLELVTSEKVRYSGTIIRGDPQHMKSIGILLIEEDMPAAFFALSHRQAGCERPGSPTRVGGKY